MELSLRSWLAAGLVPNLTRQPLKKLRSDPEALLGLVLRWQDQATKAGSRIKRIVLAFEAGRDGFLLSRKLRDQRGVARYAGLTGSPDESGSKLPNSIEFHIAY